MKRQVAITGATPPLLRWAIAQACPLRDDEPVKSLPDATFRELRSLRAAAVGESESRTSDGICLHPDSISADSSLGFPVDEVFDTYGGEDFVTHSCLSCPANVPLDGTNASELDKAGCFGWLTFGTPAESGSNPFLKLMRCQSNSPNADFSVVEKFQRAAASRIDAIQQQFLPTSPLWFGVWSAGILSGPKLELVEKIIGDVELESTGWHRLCHAIRRCRENDLALHTELVPAGFSEGGVWTLQACCAHCGIGRDDSLESVCPCCDSKNRPLRSRRSKVLGLRPYLDLVNIVGEANFQQLISRFRERADAS